MIGRSLSQRFLIFGSVFAASGVAAGAFGAHALKEILDPPSLQVFDTANQVPNVSCLWTLYSFFGN